MRASKISNRILFYEKSKVLKYPTVLFTRFRCSDKAFFNNGNVKVAGNGLKYYSTKEQQSNLKITYNSTYKYGALHSISNIPSVEFNVLRQHETKKEKVFREHKENLMSWHHTFWLQQNEEFNKEKKEYLQQRESETTITDGKERADDLSLFYKEFLDKNFYVHFKYQREWYMRSVLLMWCGFQVDLEKLLKRLTFKITRSKTA